MMQTDERLKITIDHQFVIWISHWSWIYILNFNGLIFVASACQGALPIWNPLVLLTLWRGNVTCTSILFPFGIWMQIPRQVAQNQKSQIEQMPPSSLMPSIACLIAQFVSIVWIILSCPEFRDFVLWHKLCEEWRSKKVPFWFIIALRSIKSPW